jgi:nitrite reductase (NADH) small subunit
MAEWVRLCGVAEAPAPGEVMEAEANGVAVCLANVDGRLSALDNVCPHRQGPLGQGWLEGQGVVCPWHSWVFSTLTGEAEPPERLGGRFSGGDRGSGCARAAPQPASAEHISASARRPGTGQKAGMTEDSSMVPDR